MDETPYSNVFAPYHYNTAFNSALREKLEFICRSKGHISTLITLHPIEFKTPQPVPKVSHFLLSDEWWTRCAATFPWMLRVRAAFDGEPALLCPYRGITPAPLAVVFSLMPRYFCHVTTLDLSGNPLGTDGLSLFEAAFAEFESLKVLALAHCEIDDAACIKLSGALVRVPGLTELYLHMNDIADAGLRAICRSLGDSLKVLSLWGNVITGDGCAALAPLIQRSPLTRLSLAYNYIGCTGLEQIAPHLKACPLIELDLSVCGLGPGIGQLIREMAEGQQGLTALRCWGNYIGKGTREERKENAANLLYLFRHGQNNSLAIVDLHANNISARATRKLCMALARHTSVRTANLRGNCCDGVRRWVLVLLRPTLRGYFKNVAGEPSAKYLV